MKIVVTSDWHLDAITDGVRRYGDIVSSVDQSVDRAIDEKADLYIFCGDLCDPDGWNVIKAMSYVISVAAKLSSNGIPSVWLAGNHDILDDGSGTTVLQPLAASGIACVIESPKEVFFSAIRTRVIGIPYVAQSHIYDPVKFIEGCEKQRRGETIIVIGHGILPGVLGNEAKAIERGDRRLWPLEAIKKKWHSPILLAGHYHHSGELNGVHIVGSLVRLRHDEEDHNPSILIIGGDK